MNLPVLSRHTALLLQMVTVLVGVGMLGFMLWEPHLEGRNAHATLAQIYFNDPFLAYVYTGSIPFFVALYKAFGLFGQVRRYGAFSHTTVSALRTIKRCAIAIIGFVAGALLFILLFGDGEDRPAGVFMSGVVVLLASLVVIATASLIRIVQTGLRRAERGQT
ncbi:MAG TPA: DUF2975 domain-containing protein [Opitutaceae bacterium]|nr:DUF2975 domain-containing protein [Opitutaceae bacterium]